MRLSTNFLRALALPGDSAKAAEDIKMFIYRPSGGVCILKFNLLRLGWSGKKRKLEVFIYLHGRRLELVIFIF